MTIPGQVLRGDAKGIDSQLYREALTIPAAQALVEALRREFRYLPPITVLQGRQTRRRYGYAHARSTGPAWEDRALLITLHPIGMNVGTLIHEFAHHAVAPVRGHGRAFKTMQRRVIAIYCQRMSEVR
jgi:hypothetical protein